jgi:subtilisin-like proprotein convertase family protein
MQWLAVMTAVPLDTPSDWTKTSIDRMFSHQFGYGKLDAYAIVEKAKTWKLVKPQAWFYSPWMHVRKAIPEGNQGLASSFEVTEDMLKDANFERVEHITLTMNVEHQRRGDLSVELRSPNGMVSHLSTARRDDEAPYGYIDWTFMSVAHWGESAVGKWTVIIKDVKAGNGKTGTFTDWKLRLWGESIDASKAKPRHCPTSTKMTTTTRLMTIPRIPPVSLSPLVLHLLSPLFHMITPIAPLTKSPLPLQLRLRLTVVHRVQLPQHLVPRHLQLQPKTSCPAPSPRSVCPNARKSGSTALSP